MAESGAVSEGFQKLFSEREILRSAGFHELLDESWEMSTEAPGSAQLRPNAPVVVERILEPPIPDGCSLLSVLVLLGLLVEADQGDMTASVRARVGSVLLQIIHWLEQKPASDPELGAAAFLFSHFPGDAETIMARLVSAFGAEHPRVEDLAAVFDLRPQHPARAHFFGTYLGSEACGRIGPNQLELCQEALACPRCRRQL